MLRIAANERAREARLQRNGSMSHTRVRLTERLRLEPIDHGTREYSLVSGALNSASPGTIVAGPVAWHTWRAAHKGVDAGAVEVGPAAPLWIFQVTGCSGA